MNRRKFLVSAFAASLAAPSSPAFDDEGPSKFLPQQWRQFRCTDPEHFRYEITSSEVIV